MYVWDAALILDGLGSLRICDTRWLEEFANPSDVRFLHTEAPAAHRSHITVQRINYTDSLRARVEGVSYSDFESIQALIEKPMQDLLKRSVEEVQVDQKYYRKFAVPAGRRAALELAKANARIGCRPGENSGFR